MRISGHMAVAKADTAGFRQISANVCYTGQPTPHGRALHGKGSMQHAMVGGTSRSDSTPVSTFFSPMSISGHMAVAMVDTVGFQQANVSGRFLVFVLEALDCIS